MSILCLTACSSGNTEKNNEKSVAEDAPEAVKTLQHKIDKALESEPTYEDIVEIMEEYDDLLKAEQDMITNYDKIEAMNKIDANVVSCVFAANKLKEHLKNPNSLEIIEAECGIDGDTIAVKLDYKADNSIGGSVEDEYYCLMDTPVENNDKWTCQLDAYFASLYNQEMIGSLLGSNSRGGDSQKEAKDHFDKYSDEVVEVSVDQIMDNIDMSITEIQN